MFLKRKQPRSQPVGGKEERKAFFRGRAENRFWWHTREGNDYLPPVYGFLDDGEWQILLEWFDETDRKYGPWTGECSVPAISMLQGLVMGNGIRRIVQCGHFIGYSTILLGLMLKKMGGGGQLLSIDIDGKVTRFTGKWVKRFGLEDQVRLVVSDSADPGLPAAAREQFGGEAPQLVFIDSSHQYAHTRRELDLWYPELPRGGFMYLHDASRFSQEYDATGDGGVYRAVREWNADMDDRIMLINGLQEQGEPPAGVYLDGCGLGILQKGMSPPDNGSAD